MFCMKCGAQLPDEAAFCFKAKCYGTCHQPQSGDPSNCSHAVFPSFDVPLPLGKCRISSHLRHLPAFSPD